MPEGKPIADVFVNVSPDLTGFTRKLQAAMKAAGVEAKVRVVADKTGFAASLRKAVKDGTPADLHATVGVRATTAGFAASLRKAVKEGAAGVTATVGVDARGRSVAAAGAKATRRGPVGGDRGGDAAAALREQQELARQFMVARKWDLKIDTAHARAQLADLTRDRKIKIQADAETAAAESEIAAVFLRDYKVKVKVDAAHARALRENVARDLAAAGETASRRSTQRNAAKDLLAVAPVMRAIPSLNTLQGKFATVALTAAPALFALGSSLLYASTSAAGFAPAMLGAATGLGVLALALSGPIKSFAEFVKQSDVAAVTETANATALRGATEGLSDARTAAARAARDASRQIAAAQRGEREAQEDLNDARVQAIRLLEDLRDRTEDLALDEEDAQLRLERAQAGISEVAGASGRDAMRAYSEALDLLDKAEENVASALAKSGANSKQYKGALEDLRWAQSKLTEGSKAGALGTLDQRAAVLELKRAQNGLADTQRDRARTEAEYADAQKKGVNNADVVVAAQQRLADAHTATADAQRSAAESQEDAAIAVARATFALAAVQKTQAATAAKANKANTKESAAFQAQLKSMIPLTKELQKTAERTTLPGFTRFLKASVGLFPVLNKAVGQFGAMMSDTADDIGKFISTPLFKAQLGRVLASMARAFGSIGRAIRPFLSALFSVSDAVSPLVERFAKFVEHSAKLFATFIEGKRATGELALFFRDAGDKMALWFGIVVNFGRGLLGMFRGAKTTGDDLAGTILGVGKSFAGWATSEKGRASVHRFFQKVVDLDYGRLWEIAKAVAQLYVTYALFNAATTIAKHPFWWLFASFAVAHPQALAQMLDLVWRAAEPIMNFLADHPHVFNGLIALLTAAKVAQLTGVAGMFTALSGVSGAATTAGAAGAGVAGAATGLAAPALLAGSLIVIDPLHVFDRPKAWVADFGRFVGGMGQSFAALIAHGIGNTDIPDGTVVEQDAPDSASATHRRARNAAAAAAAAKAAKEKSDRFFSAAQRASGARTTFQQTVDAIDTTVARNGTTLDKNTEKGKANREMILASAKAAVEHGKAVQQVTGDVRDGVKARDSDIVSLRAQAIRYGLSKAEVDKLIQSVLALPVTRTTTLRADVSNAQTNIAAIDLALRNPALTAEHRAVLTARKEKLEAELAAAQKKLTAYAAAKWAANLMLNIVPTITGPDGKPVGLGVVTRTYAAAEGGQIQGPGTRTSDSVPILASRDEWVVRAGAAMSLGNRAMTVINNADRLGPRFTSALLTAIPAPRSAGNRRLSAGGPVTATATLTPAAAMAPPQVHVAAPQVRVYIGEREIHDSVRVVVAEREDSLATALMSGRRP